MYVHIMYYQNQGLQGQRQEYILILTHFTSDEIISLLTQEFNATQNISPNFVISIYMWTCIRPLKYS